MNVCTVYPIQICALYFICISLHFLGASNAILQLSSRLVDVRRNYKTRYPDIPAASFKNSLKKTAAEMHLIEIFFNSTGHNFKSYVL